MNIGPSLEDLITEFYSRRQALRGGAGVVGAVMLAGCGDSGGDGDGDAPPGADPAPVLTLSRSGTASAGQTVTLTATVTDNGTIIAMVWRQVSGPAVTLSSTTAAIVSFVVPAVDAATDLVFEFQATDNAGNVASARITVGAAAFTLGFAAVPKSLADLVTVPAGYRVKVLIRTGDPIVEGVAEYPNTGTSRDFYEKRMGDGCAGLAYFGYQDASGAYATNSSRGILVISSEDINAQYLDANGPVYGSSGVRDSQEAQGELEALGITDIEVFDQGGGDWGYSRTSAHRHYTAILPYATLTGPATADATLVRSVVVASTASIDVSPWGTALCGEANWAPFFRRPASDNAARPASEVTALLRYGVLSDRGKYGWATVDGVRISVYFQIFDATATHTNFTGTNFKHYVRSFGWICELDPYAPTIYKKRTALGRMNHRGCAPGLRKAGVRPAFYLPDDGVNEYLYKFVSATSWSESDSIPAAPATRVAAGDTYLDAGTLYVARFAANGTGQWLPLTFGTAPLTAANAAYPFASQADVLINARLAGDALGATPMDRPGGVAVNPVSELYLSLVNNAARTSGSTNAPNPRPANTNGHTVRLRETGDSGEALSFAWDIALFGAASTQSSDVNVSGLTADNDFAGPRALSFARSVAPYAGKPILFVSTADDTGYPATNNQLLVAVPGAVGDGGSTAWGAQPTVVGKKLDASVLRRFLVAPDEAKVGGSTLTPDGRTLFVAIQLPGQRGTSVAPTSHWPDSQATGTAGASVRPRSAIVVVTRADGGVIGL